MGSCRSKGFLVKGVAVGTKGFLVKRVKVGFGLEKRLLIKLDLSLMML